LALAPLTCTARRRSYVSEASSNKPSTYRISAQYSAEHVPVLYEANQYQYTGTRALPNKVCQRVSSLFTVQV